MSPKPLYRILFMVFMPFCLFAQREIPVADVLSREIIQNFRAVGVNGKQIRIENGRIFLPAGDPADSVLISKAGYQPVKIPVSFPGDTVFMEPEYVENIRPIVISMEKRKRKKIRFKGSVLYNLGLPNTKDIVHEMMIPREYRGRKIISLSFKTQPYTSGKSKIRRVKGTQKLILRADTSRILVEIYRDTMDAAHLLYRSDAITVIHSKRKTLALDLENANVYLPEGKLIFSFEKYRMHTPKNGFTGFLQCIYCRIPLGIQSFPGGYLLF